MKGWRSATNILNLIAVPFVIVALLSSYGLYQTMDNYARVTETTFNHEVHFSEVSIAFTSNGDAGIHMVLNFVNTNSKLDLRINTAVCRVYTQGMEDQYYVAVGSRSFFDTPETAIIPAGGNLSISIDAKVEFDSRYMERLEGSRLGDGYVLTILAEIRYEFVAFPERQDITGALFPPGVVRG